MMLSCRSMLYLLISCCYLFSWINGIDQDRFDSVDSTSSKLSLSDCLDGRKTNDESDVDCGGMKCPRCEHMKSCKTHCDCISGLCQDKKCIPSTSCDDKMKNQDETDIDCGGILCRKCSTGKNCKVNCDCIGGICKDNLCQGGCNPSCKNNGKCIENKCSCPSGYKGLLCEIESFGLCSTKELSKSEPILLITFDKGTSQYSKKTPKDYGFTTTYQQRFAPSTDDGYFSLVNSIPNDFGDSWHKDSKDHTGNRGGYMLLVNADYKPGEFYRSTIKNLCLGQRYEFSTYLANICRIAGCDILPNVLFEIRSVPDNELLAQLNSGPIEKNESLLWKKYGISFLAKTKSVTLLMISNAPGGNGNDLVIDDIALRACLSDGSRPTLCPADD